MSEQRLRPFTDEEETEEARHDWVPREPAAHEFERRASKARDHEGNIVGYYFDADLWREVRARLAAVEALHVRETVPWVCRTCRTQWPCLTHRALAADPADTTR